MTRMRSNLLIKTYQGLFCSAILLKHGIDNSCLASLSSPSLANFQHELSTTTKSHNVTLLLPTVAPKVNQHRSHEEQRYILSVSEAATTTGTENIRKRNYTQSHAYFGTSTKLCIAHHPTTSQSPIFSTLAYITPFHFVQP